jgi:DNA polymerase-1
MPERSRLFLIDGSSYIYRAFYAIGHLSNSKGLPTNAVYGFLQMLLKVVKVYHPEYLLVVFDAKAPTFRSEIFEAYKAHRPAMPENLVPQIPYIKRILEVYRIARLEMEGYEADDLIGTVATLLEKDADVTILSGDKDMLQLVSEHVQVVDPMKEKRFGVAEVVERYGLKPEQIVDMMGLAGDASDNIPGVPGIGEKTATGLIQTFGSLENLFAHLDQVPQKKLREKLETYGEQARMSRRLAVIHNQVPIAADLEAFRLGGPDLPALREILREMEFTKLLKELPGEKNDSGKEYHLVTDRSVLDRLVNDLRGAALFALDLETTSPYPMWADLIGISLSFQPRRAFYIPLGHRSLEAVRQLPEAEVFARLKPLLEDPAIQKVGQNLKPKWIVLQRYGITLRGIHCDTMLASYLLHPTKHHHFLEEIAQEYLDRTLTEYQEVVGSGGKAIPFDQAGFEEARDYSCEKAEVAIELSRLLLPRLSAEGARDLLDRVELPLLTVLGKMERTGVRIDRDLLCAFSKEMENRLQQKMERIHGLAGEAFNINSSQQLGKILFEKLGLPASKRTKTGYSTDVDVLMRLSLQHELPLEVLGYRNLSKLKSTYIDALPKLVHPKTGRVHTSYHQTVTATGRLSSSDPNLQNIPIRTEEGNRIREAFIPEKGHVLLSADYSQIELRILAHLSRDPVLVKAFQEEEDVHTRTASEVFHVPVEGVNPQMRREAKAINFGILYGMSPYGLSQQLGVETKVAQAYIDEYFQRYAGVKTYIEECLAEARRQGYVTTLLNRRRYLPELQSPNQAVRQASERMAINSPLQGTAADIIKLAMIRIQDRIEALGLAMRMIMQVHDELVFEVPESEGNQALLIIPQIMETVMDLSVPLKVSVHSGKNWAEAH